MALTVIFAKFIERIFAVLTKRGYENYECVAWAICFMVRRVASSDTIKIALREKINEKNMKFCLFLATFLLMVTEIDMIHGKDTIT